MNWQGVNKTSVFLQHFTNHVSLLFITVCGFPPGMPESMQILSRSGTAVPCSLCSCMTITHVPMQGAVISFVHILRSCRRPVSGLCTRAPGARHHGGSALGQHPIFHSILHVQHHCALSNTCTARPEGCDEGSVSLSWVAKQSTFPHNGTTIRLVFVCTSPLQPFEDLRLVHLSNPSRCDLLRRGVSHQYSTHYCVGISRACCIFESFSFA